MTDIMERRALPRYQIEIEDFDDLSLSSVGHSSYRFEAERLRSFENWPVSYIEPEKLTAVGLYYLGTGDKVKCFVCRIEIYQWVEGDDPEEEHKRCSDRCAFLRKLPCGNVPIGLDRSTEPLPEPSYDVCGLYESRSQQNTANNALTSELHQFASQVSPISAEEARQMDVPSFIKKVEPPLSSKCNEGIKVENAFGPSHKVEENAIEVEGSSSSTAVKACKDLNNLKRHGCKSVDDGRKCKICYKGELGVVFLPCGHIVACVKCATKITTCGVCRVPVAKNVQAFLS